LRVKRLVSWGRGARSYHFRVGRAIAFFHRRGVSFALPSRGRWRRIAIGAWIEHHDGATALLWEIVTWRGAKQLSSFDRGSKRYLRGSVRLRWDSRKHTERKDYRSPGWIGVRGKDRRPGRKRERT
jgi:hypothetical protein